MHPYLPFAALPVAVISAWFAASNWTLNDPGRYVVPRVVQLEDPTELMKTRPQSTENADIRVEAFLPPVKPRPPAPEPTLILQSVMTGTGVRLATINGQVVKEGDRIKGYLVRRITADGVELEKGERTRRLPMRPLHELPSPTKR